MDRRSLTRFASFAIGVLVASVSFADTFNLFQPATGILVGTSSTYVTRAATNTDVIPLWSGTCGSTTYLRGDGTCATPPGTGGGTVNSVSLTAPSSLFSITGSPVTNSGTLALSYATGQTPTQLFGTDGSGNVSLFSLTGNYVPPIQLNSTANGGIANTLGVAHGGSGVATLTAHGVLLGQGASPFSATAAMAADTVLQGQGVTADPAAATLPNCGSGTQALSYSTSTHAFGCQTISAAAGTVTSVGMTVPSVMSVSPASITSSGTFAVTFASGQTGNRFLRTPNGTTGALALGPIVSADLPLIDAGTGLSGSLPVSLFNAGVGASSSTCWFGDGTWKTCGGAGSGVTSVALSLPSVFSVSGSPITTSGTLAATFTAGQTANMFLATPNGLTGALGLRSIASPDLPASIASNTSGNAATATALAATPTQCASGNVSTGIAANGSANCTSAPPGTVTSLTSGTGITLSPSTITTTGSVAVNQGANFVWTGTDLSSGGVISSVATPGVNIGSSANHAVYRMVDTNGPANGKAWQMTTAGGAGTSFAIQAVTDDWLTTFTSALTIARTFGAASISNVSLGNATDNPTYNFNGSGASTFSGPINANSTAGVALTVNGTSGNTALVVNPQSSTTGISVVSPSAATASIALRGNNNAGGAAGVVSQDASSNVHLGNLGNAAINLDTNGVNRVSISGGGAVTLNSPTSGIVLSATALNNSPVTFNGAGTSGGSALKLVGNFTGSGTSSLLQILDPNNANGANIMLTGDGVTTPNKFVRVAAGTYQILNSAYTQSLFSLSDNGNLTLPSITASNQTVLISAPSGQVSSVFLAANGNATGSSLLIQQDASHNAYIRNQDTGSLSLGVGSTNYWQINSNGGLSQLASPVSGHALNVDGNTSSSSIVVDSFGYPWTTQGAIDMGAWGSIQGETNVTNWTGNLFWSSTNWAYKTTAAGSLVRQDGSGNIILSTAPSGVANALVTPTQQLEVFNSGGVTIGSPTGSSCGLGCLNAVTIEKNGTPLSASATTDATNAVNIISGTLADARTSSNIAKLGTIQTWSAAQTFAAVTATSFAGNGASITGINASNLTSGTLSSGLLPSTITANTTGNAATASALATAPTQCAGGNYSTGITTVGNANCTGLPANPTITLSGAVSGSGTTTIPTTLNLAISPTLTGNWVHSASSGVGLTILGNGASDTIDVNASAGNTATISIAGNGNANTSSVLIQQSPTLALMGTQANQNLVLFTNNIPAVTIFADHGVIVDSPAGGDKGSGTVNIPGTYFQNNVPVCLQNGTNCPGSGGVTGTFTGTLTGMTSTVTAVFKYRITSGSLVSLWILSGTTSGTSNTTAMTLNGMPAAIRPSAIVVVSSPQIYNNNVATYASCQVDSGGTITFTPSSAPVGGGAVTNTGVFLASGTKGLAPSWQITYDLEN